MLGVYLSGHPLDDYRELIEKNTTASVSEILEVSAMDMDGMSENMPGMESAYGRYRDGDRVIMAGMLVSVKTMITRKAQEMARIQFEDFSGIMDVIIFPTAYEKFRHLVQTNQIVAISGKLSIKEDSAPEVLVDNLADIHQIQEFRRRGNFRPGRPNSAGRPNPNPSGRPTEDVASLVKLRVPPEYVERLGSRNLVLEEIKGILKEYPGNRDVMVFLPGGRNVKTSSQYRVDFSEKLERRLKDLLGNDNVKG